ncbi:MAG: tRNA pseudouridine(55) synthase TruB [Patescibacteria group bacterium]
MENKSIVLIDKPSGITSFDCIRRLRRILGISKMGHAGTLDPLATGLMVIGVGREGTRALNDFKGVDKEYEVTALMGVGTTTGDVDGEVLEEVKVNISSKEAKDVVLGLEGEHNIPVPIYSAIKKDGKPLYWYARKGIAVEPPVKKMTVKRALFKGLYEENGKIYMDLSLKVSSGAYIRALVEELGRELKVPATVSALRRTMIGDKMINEATPLDSVTAQDILKF